MALSRSADPSMPLKLTLCHRIVLLIAVFTLGKGTHYRGGTFSYVPRNLSDLANGEVRIRFKIAWRQGTAEGTCPVNEADRPTTLLGSPVKWRCLSKNCGSRTVNDMRSYCTFANTRDDYYQGEKLFYFTFPVANAKLFRVGIDPESNHRCCWIPTTNSDIGDMRMFTTIDFTPRPDNGLLNRSPITDIVPLVPARTGCRHRLFIPHSDPDVQDNVKCRWARTSNDTFQDECGIVCNRLEIAPYNVSLDESTCEMMWTPPSPGLYSAAVQLEDFAPGSNRPLSSIPLQFLVEVNDPVLGCDHRPFFPPQERFPCRQQRCFAVPSGGNFTFELMVGHSAYPRRNVSAFFSTKPSGMRVSPIQEIPSSPSLRLVDFFWQPTPEQEGIEHFFCFFASDNESAATDHACLTVIPGYAQPEVLLSTRYPLEASITPYNATAKISFTEEVRRPSNSRYIRVFHFLSDQLVQVIDTETDSLISVSADKKTVSFNLVGSNYTRNETYYILLEEGAFVGTVSCAGGGPVATGVLAKGEWKFVSDGIPDLNECKLNKHKCHENATCHNVYLSYVCLCNHGFTGNGFQCSGIDKCKSNPCNNGARCRDLINNYSCECLNGYTGSDCETIVDESMDVCSSQPCQNNATCEGEVGRFACHCQPGYTGSLCEKYTGVINGSGEVNTTTAVVTAKSGGISTTTAVVTAESAGKSTTAAVVTTESARKSTTTGSLSAESGGMSTPTAVVTAESAGKSTTAAEVTAESAEKSTTTGSVAVESGGIGTTTVVVAAIVGFVVIVSVIVIIYGITVVMKKRHSNLSSRHYSEAADAKNQNVIPMVESSAYSVPQNVILMAESPLYGSSLPQDDPHYESISCHLASE